MPFFSLLLRPAIDVASFFVLHVGITNSVYMYFFSVLIRQAQIQFRKRPLARFAAIDSTACNHFVLPFHVRGPTAVFLSVPFFFAPFIARYLVFFFFNLFYLPSFTLCFQDVL